MKDYLSWIRKKTNKDIVKPELVFFPLSISSGRYYSPQKGRILFDENKNPYPMDNGIIVISNRFKESCIKQSIVHEWRHHCQYFMGMKYDILPWQYLLKTLGYEKALKKYFRDSNMERDALQFQYKHAGIPDLWYEHLSDLLTE